MLYHAQLGGLPTSGLCLHRRPGSRTTLIASQEGLGILHLALILLPLFTRVRGRRILRTSPFGHSRKFAPRRNGHLVECRPLAPGIPTSHARTPLNTDLSRKLCAIAAARDASERGGKQIYYAQFTGDPKQPHGDKSEYQPPDAGS